MSPVAPSCGEVWFVDLEPRRGHEQGGVRPSLIVSVDRFDHGPAGLVIVAPLTTRKRDIPTHVRVDPPEGGLPRISFVKCEDVRSVAKERLRKRAGNVSAMTMAQVRDRLRILLDL